MRLRIRVLSQSRKARKDERKKGIASDQHRSEAIPSILRPCLCLVKNRERSRRGVLVVSSTS